MGCVFRDDEEAVGLSEGGEIAGALPENRGDLREGVNRWIECAERGKKAREAGLGFAIGIGGELREDEARIGFPAAGECGEYGGGEEEEGCGGGDGVTRKAEEGDLSMNWG